MNKVTTIKNKIGRHKEISGFLEKIVINAGVGRLSQQPNFEQKILPQILGDISAIAGQKPEVTKAKKSIAGFKTREGQIVGIKVTLRRRKMVDFFERLITIVMPRFRDFRGLETAIIDNVGTLNIGFPEQTVFPEINQEESPITFSLGVNIVPKTKSREKAIEEYRRLGVPLKKLKSEIPNHKS
ncbi:MAG: 50S ribosomal protein L5 [Candidatus Liptonbacteria bacterium]|nr:50S ribosomal protein L5 [Candidatus Liptonbacteria bacterium]